jgi:hypothetical protein
LTRISAPETRWASAVSGVPGSPRAGLARRACDPPEMVRNMLSAALIQSSIVVFIGRYALFLFMENQTI